MAETYTLHVAGLTRERPSGIDFTGGNIFNIIFIFDIIVFGAGVRWRSIMDDYIFGGWSSKTAFVTRRLTGKE